MTEADILALARKFTQYEADGKLVTLRGASVVEFARALMAAQEVIYIGGDTFEPRITAHYGMGITAVGTPI